MTHSYENSIKVTHFMRNRKLPNTMQVGRPSPLGNPFTHYKTGTLADVTVGSVEEAVQCYEAYLDEEIESGNEAIIAQLQQIIAMVQTGETVHLACWCKDEVTPFQTDSKICHADVIRNVILDELDAMYEDEQQ